MYALGQALGQIYWTRVGERKNGRSEAIWTPDIQFPKLALYQAELRSDQAPKGLGK